MRITCPFCGERDSSEFVVAGDASVHRPTSDDPQALARFVETAYIRENPIGRHAELWYHAMGCHSWLRVTRDTRTHQIFGVAFTRDVTS